MTQNLPVSEHGLQLSSGRTMPPVGLGVWKIEPGQTARIVRTAIDAGYRHFDCACDYGNEAQVGQGLADALSSGAVCREELWITSKLWNTFHRPEHVRPALERTLRDLQLDFLDLYLIHFPIAQKFVPFETRYPPGWFFDPDAAEPRMEFDRVPISATWQAMEELQTAGLVREIGVCNFGTALLRDLICHAQVPPAVLQVELHPYLTQERLLRFCREAGIAVTAFSPLGALSYFSLQMARPEESVLAQPVIQEIAARHSRTPAQIVLRWGVQRGTAIVPKTTQPDRLAENLSLFDFELTEDEMTAISQLNRNRRFNDPGDFCETAFNTFCPIYD